ncbi:MAG: hypothetical protein ACR2PP_09330 [Psychrobacter sp.]
MGDFKLPVALIFTMIIQAAGLVYWVSQQAATVSQLKEDMSGVASRMAIEDQVNLKRDVSRNTENIDEVWEDLDSMSVMLDEQLELKRRVALIETELKYMNRGHPNIKD